MLWKSTWETRLWSEFANGGVLGQFLLQVRESKTVPTPQLSLAKRMCWLRTAKSGALVSFKCSLEQCPIFLHLSAQCCAPPSVGFILMLLRVTASPNLASF